MVYHRKTHKRAHRRHPFSKRQEKAIQRMVLQPSETHRLVLSRGFNSNWTPAQFSGNQTAAYRNIMAGIPRGNENIAPQSEAVQGDKFILKGVKVQWSLYYPRTTSTLCVRVSIIQSDAYLGSPTSSTPVAQFAVATGDNNNFWEENDGSTQMTFQKFNIERITVLKSEKFYMTNGAGTGMFREGSMWWGCNRKETCANEENVLISDYVTELKDRNYYLLWEMYDPAGILSTATPAWDFNVMTTVYWKDP